MQKPLPLAVILVVPMCILGSLAGVWVTRGDVNIFTQIGFVVLVGLASKNAILIVEFAKHKREAGLTRREATLEACKLRLRPILMTSFAFILGVVPLILGHGAGAEMRRVLGIAVFSGMLGVTLFGIFLTPVFFYVIDGLAEVPLWTRLLGRRRAAGTPAPRPEAILVGLNGHSSPPHPVARCTTTKNTGVRKRPNAVTPSIPANTAVPSARRISAPAPSASTSGTTPIMNATDRKSVV